MRIKISSWKTLINNELQRLYADKRIRLWFAQYGVNSKFRTHYKYREATTLEEFVDLENWYDWTDIKDFTVVINSITNYGPQTKSIKIKFDPIDYNGNIISEVIFSNKILELV